MSEGLKLTIVSESSGAQPEEISRNLTVGEKLAAARSNQELSVDQIAGQLKWSSRQIAEIEAGNYSVFPDMLTVRGFVRSYAKFLKIDPAPLLEQLLTEFDKLPSKPIDRPKLDTPFSTGRMPWLNQQHNSSQKIVAGLFLAFLCLLAAFVWRAEIQHFVAGFIPAGSEKLAVHPESVAVSPNLQTEEKTLNASEDINRPAQENNSTAQQPASVDQNATAAMSTNSSQPEPQKTLQATEVSSTDALVLNFKQDSWVQIKRLNGSVVTSRLYKAGTDEVISVNEPMNMVIGNAPGVEAKLRGQKLVLPAQTGTNVSNLSIK
jgi:cytoskeleton protein RodZ